jgi:hypothetical protein
MNVTQVFSVTVPNAINDQLLRMWNIYRHRSAVYLTPFPGRRAVYSYTAPSGRGIVNNKQVVRESDDPV